MSKFQVGDDLVIDSDQRRVHKNDIKLNLPELSYRLLLTLVESSPHIVSHNDLMVAVWRDRVVSDENLKKRVSRLREALGDTSDNPKYIIVERGMGYRCIAAVNPFIAEGPEKQINGSVTLQYATETTQTRSQINFPVRKTVKPNKAQWQLKAIISIFLISCAALFFGYFSYDFFSSSSKKSSSSNLTAKDYAFQASQYNFRFNRADNNKAITLYKKSLAEAPGISTTLSGLAEAYAQGYFLFGEGEAWLQQALSYSEQAIAISPEKSWGYSSQGLALYLSGRFSESIVTFEKANKLAPEWGKPLAYLALAHLETGNAITAYQLANKALEKEPTSPVVNVIMGLSYRELNMPKQAKVAFEKSREYNPEYLLAQSYLAELSLMSGDTFQAKSLLTSMGSNATTTQFEHWLFAQFHLQAGELALASKSFESAALLGGRYSLPAQVYLAVLNKDAHQLKYFYQQLTDKINQGNQWSELAYGQGLILLAEGNILGAITLFKQVIDMGLKHEYRFNNFPLLFSIAKHPKFDSLLKELKQKNKQMKLSRVPG